jgi:glycerophosphoryl diester phosphodiesterase
MKWEIGAGLGILGAYLAAITPGRKNRWMDTDTVFYAHRGLHDNQSDAPENTMRAFARACDMGYGIEMDIQLTKDRQVVVFHDNTLKRVCAADGQISDYTYQELQQFRVCGTDQKIPLFSEVLKLVDGRVPLIIELKYKNFSNRVCVEADKILSHYHGVYCIESFHPWALLWYRKHRPKICRGQLSMNFQRQEGNYQLQCFIVRHLLTNFLTHPDFIAYDLRDRGALSKNLCRRLYGCPSVAWTVRSRQQLEGCRKYYDAFIFEGFRP